MVGHIKQPSNTFAAQTTAQSHVAVLLIYALKQYKTWGKSKRLHNDPAQKSDFQQNISPETQLLNHPHLKGMGSATCSCSCLSWSPSISLLAELTPRHSLNLEFLIIIMKKSVLNIEFLPQLLCRRESAGDELTVHIYTYTILSYDTS